MKRGALILLGSVTVFFLLSIWLKSASADAEFLQAFYVTVGAFLTLGVFSFLYKDNPIYKFTEHLYVGVSAAYWMCQAFWSVVVNDLFIRLSPALSKAFHAEYQGFEWHYLIPVAFGVMLLLRMSENLAWLSRWTLAFLVGATAGLNLPTYLIGDFLGQISNTFVPLVVRWNGFGDFIGNLSLAYNSQLVAIASNWVVALGVISGLVYFYFSKEHKGAFGAASRFGVWILMLTFGASFGYTVMGRVSLLVGRLTFLFRDWLGIIS